MKDKILCQAGIHVFFLKASVAIIAFLITAVVVQQLQGLASQESKLSEAKAVEQAQVDFYKEQKILQAEDKLKQKIALAKLAAISDSINTNDALLNLNESLMDLCWILSFSSLFIGLFFWYLHIPYVQVPSSNIEKNVLDTEDFSVSVFSSTEEPQQYLISVKRT
ncbi:hypothetical protein ACRWQM_10165 [Shewanella sp. HL-SH5]|uniref:hypothetical protein n=1 Tax=Shewanella sp. HL-SH5 TaxID=3436241 RepID=UPI003EB9FC64